VEKMYVTQANQCDMPNSETPITAAEIAALYAYGDAVGSHFVNGNATMAQIVDGLTPPVPVGQCSDFTSSRSMRAITPFPLPLPPGYVASGAPGAPDSGAVDSETLSSAVSPAGLVAATAPAAATANTAAPPSSMGAGATSTPLALPPGATSNGGGIPPGYARFRPGSQRRSGYAFAGPPGSSYARGRGVGPSSGGKGYSNRYPYGAIVDSLAQQIPAWQSCPNPANAAAANPVAGLVAAANANGGAVLWGVLLALGLGYAVASSGMFKGGASA
jgi:hypothetical protein